MTESRNVALVTGANKGIGFHVAAQLAEAGVHVLMGCRDQQRGSAAADKLRTADGRVEVLLLDVTDDASIAAAAQRVADEHGRLDVLVNNAGITSGLAPTSQVTRVDLRRTFETNVFGVAAVTNAFLPLLRAAERARVLNISRELGSANLVSDADGPFGALNNAAYQTSKSAVGMLTVLYSKELAGSGITVDAVGPGYRATELNGGLPTPGAGDPADGAAAVVAAALDTHPGTGRFINHTGQIVPW
jgi:NAD(P)-dependent dehydrogenase (short-subunit alcohol dehydrogenase family)